MFPLWTALFSFPLMVAVTNYVRTSRHGYWTGPRRGIAAQLFSLGFVGRLHPVDCCQCGEHWRGSRRHGRCDCDDDRHKATGLYTDLCGTDHVFAFLDLVSIHRAGFQVADAGPFRLCNRGLSCKTRLGSSLRSTFIPHVEWSSAYLATFVGILGTTISPYLFFWQAAEEVEEERKMGRRSVGSGAEPPMKRSESRARM